MQKELSYDKISVKYSFGLESESVEMDCENQNPTYVFNPTASIIEISNVERVVSMKGTSAKYGSYTNIERQNLKTGEVHIKAEGGGKSIDCIEKYTPLANIGPVTDRHELEEIMSLDLEDQQNRVSTTCPAWYYDDSDDNSDDYTNYSGSGTVLANYIITDSSNKKHKFSSQIVSKSK